MNADELPPGEYEILAMFDGDEGVPKPVGPNDRKDAAKSIAHHQQVLEPFCNPDNNSGFVN